MCTFPRSDWSYEKAAGSDKKDKEDYGSYFNECMNGLSIKSLAHDLEEMVQEGLAIERAIHDRYHAARRTMERN